MDGLRYRFFIGGQSHQILRFLKAFDEELRPHFQEAGITEAEDSIAKRQELTFKTTAAADAGASTFIGGLVLFALYWEKGTDLFMAQWCWSKINLSHFL